MAKRGVELARWIDLHTGGSGLHGDVLEASWAVAREFRVPGPGGRHTPLPMWLRPG